MKKFLSVLLILNILCTPVLAEYDFSDAAQAEFDRNQKIQIKDNFSKARKKEDYKSNEILNPVQNDHSDRTNYEPSSLLYEPLPEKRPLYGYVVTVPSGTAFDVTFDSGISSGSLEKDDRLTVRLTNDFLYNGKLIAPAGSLVYGSASDARNAGYAYGNAEIELNFNEILTPDGNIIKISTENVYMKTKSERVQKMTRDVVVGALGSMAVAALFTALGGGNSDDLIRNLAIYGGIGAVGGGVRGTLQRGQEVDIPDGTTIKIRLNQPLYI